VPDARRSDFHLPGSGPNGDGRGLNLLDHHPGRKRFVPGGLRGAYVDLMHYAEELYQGALGYGSRHEATARATPPGCEHH
jgi:hypothetical protein